MPTRGLSGLLITASTIFIAVPFFSLVWTWACNLTNAAVPAWLHNTTFLVMYWAFFSVYSLVVVALAVRRRNLQPLKSRNLLMLLVSSFCGYLLQSWMTLAAAYSLFSSTLGCDITRWLVNITYPGLTLPYLLRSLRLYLIFKWYGASRSGMRGPRLDENNSSMNSSQQPSVMTSRSHSVISSHSYYETPSGQSYLGSRAGSTLHRDASNAWRGAGVAALLSGAGGGAGGSGTDSRHSAYSGHSARTAGAAAYSGTYSEPSSLDAGIAGSMPVGADEFSRSAGAATRGAGLTAPASFPASSAAASVPAPVSGLGAGAVSAPMAISAPESAAGVGSSAASSSTSGGGGGGVGGIASSLIAPPGSENSVSGMTPQQSAAATVTRSALSTSLAETQAAPTLAVSRSTSFAVAGQQQQQQPQRNGNGNGSLAPLHEGDVEDAVAGAGAGAGTGADAGVGGLGERTLSRSLSSSMAMFSPRKASPFVGADLPEDDPAEMQWRAEEARAAAAAIMSGSALFAQYEASLAKKQQRGEVKSAAAAAAGGDAAGRNADSKRYAASTGGGQQGDGKSAAAGESKSYGGGQQQPQHFSGQSAHSTDLDGTVSHTPSYTGHALLNETLTVPLLSAHGGASDDPRPHMAISSADKGRALGGRGGGGGGPPPSAAPPLPSAKSRKFGGLDAALLGVTPGAITPAGMSQGSNASSLDAGADRVAVAVAGHRASALTSAATLATGFGSGTFGGAGRIGKTGISGFQFGASRS